MVFVCGSIVLLIALFLIFNLTRVLHRENPRYQFKPADLNLIPGCEPLEFKSGNRRAILYIHGLTSSPALFGDIAEGLNEDGYDVFVPLLPGHGSDPENLSRANFSQIYWFIEQYYLTKRLDYEDFHIVGSSLGALIALRLAESFADTDYQPTSVAPIAAPLFLFAPWRGIFDFPLVLVARFVGLFSQGFAKTTLVPELETKDQAEGDDGKSRFGGYRGHFPRLGYSILLGVRFTRKRLALIDEPLYSFHASHDRVVSYKNEAFLLREISSPLTRHWVANMDSFTHARHDLLLYDSQRLKIRDELLSFWAETEGCDRDLS
jgi:esterase/lipase